MSDSAKIVRGVSLRWRWKAPKISVSAQTWTPLLTVHA